MEGGSVNKLSGHGGTPLGIVSNNMRKNIIRMIYQGQAGHPGGSLSCVDILAALYTQILNIDPLRPDWEDRDRFILSKGHASPALYAALAEKGFLAAEELLSFDQINSRFQGHPDMKKTPGVDMSSGSLGQGLSVGVGMALGARMLHKKCKVWVLLGDGELQEGQIWEAAMSAAKYELSDLIAIVDVNDLQLAGAVDTIMPLEPLTAKWEAFGWCVLSIDGHNYEEILAAAQKAQEHRRQPTVILAKTVKGKGVSFMEGKVEWHARPITTEEMEQAIAEFESLSKGAENCG